MRHVLKHLASSVSVVTAAHNRELAGMTISSLSSVSLKPYPLVSLNIQVPSRTSRLIHASGGLMVVNILEALDSSIELARAFAGLTSKGHDFNPFAEFPDSYDLNKQGIPILKCSSGYLECSIEQLMKVQDHELIIARVRDAVHKSGEPLIYHNQAFRKMLGQ